MLAEPEHYKGILYIRISALPREQRQLIQENHKPEFIVKILKEDALMNDCILYSNYLSWYKGFNATRALVTGNSAAPSKQKLTEIVR